jgi:hypothetical protein
MQLLDFGVSADVPMSDGVMLSAIPYRRCKGRSVHTVRSQLKAAAEDGQHTQAFPG